MTRWCHRVRYMVEAGKKVITLGFSHEMFVIVDMRLFLNTSFDEFPEYLPKCGAHLSHAIKIRIQKKTIIKTKYRLFQQHSHWVYSKTYRMPLHWTINKWNVAKNSFQKSISILFDWKIARSQKKQQITE